MLFDTQSRERDEDKHYKFLSLRKKTLQPFRESPVNPLIAESLSPKPVVGVYLVAFPALAVGLYIAGYYIDNQTGNPFYWLWNPAQQNSAQALGTTLRTLANVLALILTSSGVILQLASNRYPQVYLYLCVCETRFDVVRYSEHTYHLFFADKTINVIIGFIAFSGAFCTLALFTSTSPVLLHFSYITSMVFLIIFASLREDFVRPGSEDICKVKCIRYIDYLMDLGRMEIQRSGKSLAFSVIDSVMMVAHHYIKKKHAKTDKWFQIPFWLRQTPDFISMSDDLIIQLEDCHLWFEFKIFRAFLGRREGSFILDCHTYKEIGRAGNTYLRTAIAGKQTRMAYSVMNQYRLLCEFMIVHICPLERFEGQTNIELPTFPGKARLKQLIKSRVRQEDLAEELKLDEQTSSNSSISEKVEKVLLKIIGTYWPHYLVYSHDHKQHFVAETIAYDQATLLDVAYLCSVTCHDEMLQMALPIGLKYVDKARGILRARIKLATSYLVFESGNYAQQIADSVAAAVPIAEVERACLELQLVEDREFWEINDRMVNFDYITQRQKEYLPQFLAMVQNSEHQSSSSQSSGHAHE